MARSRRPRRRPVEPRERQDLVWRKMDLHIHTPASADYLEDNVTFLQILRTAEARGIDILAFTDHNTVRGYARMWREIEDLELLEALDRLQPDEAEVLAEYRRLLNQILVLPGFEFTATFGFHILAIFPEDTSIRKLEHLLLALNVPEDKLDLGSSEVGATTDVLKAYEILNEAGGIVIGAHVNSTHGIAMQRFPFGGQTKIAYTQSPHLHALEATDLDNSSSRSTARFFSGTKPEYPRRMHCIQGDDAHRLTRDPKRETNLGIGDRITEILLPELSFKAIKAVLEGNDFSRIRPYRPFEAQLQQVQAARNDGDNSVQSFHERMASRRGKTNSIFKDIVAFANAGGGAIYVGLDATPENDITGVSRAAQAVERLRLDVSEFITPQPSVSVDVIPAGDKEIIVVTVPPGAEKPYALLSGEIYVRREAETAIATRDEIVQMVQSTLSVHGKNSHEPDEGGEAPSDRTAHLQVDQVEAGSDIPVPRTGVEIVASEDRDGVLYHTLYDLRNRRMVQNVTRTSARRLWRYAIQQHEAGRPDMDNIQWHGPFGLIRAKRQSRGVMRYDLAYRENGHLRIFYGVTLDGVNDVWRSVIPENPPVEASTH